MTTLPDQIDRLSRHSKAIKDTTIKTGASTPGVAGPFTRAVLNTSLGDLIREIDPSEIGLFSLDSVPATNPPDTDAKSARNFGIKRVEFHGATPLRKPSSRREDTHKPKEVEPEVYAQAALKYIHRYEPIRPMPRAHSQAEAIIEQLATMRNSIQALGDTLSQIQKAEAPSLKVLADEEERRVQELQTRVAELKKRKDEALTRHRAKLPRAKPPAARPKPKDKPLTPAASTSKPDVHEEMFWATPAGAPRTLRFTDNLLMDEDVDLGDISTTSFGSPTPAHSAIGSFVAPERGEEISHDPVSWSVEEIKPLLAELERNEPLSHEKEMLKDKLEDGDGEDEDEENEDEKTVVLKKNLLPQLSLPPISAPSLHTEDSDVAKPEPKTPQTATPKRPKVKVNTEVERIVAKLWLTMGDIIMPGHPFDTSGLGSGNRPPFAKETIGHLQSLSAQIPAPLSPSLSSTSSHSAATPLQPTAQQILTAHLLISLLQSPPHFSMALNKLKESLTTKAGACGLNTVGQGSTRVLYGCVAKRLLKIERGGGEQVVKFDV